MFWLAPCVELLLHYRAGVLRCAPVAHPRLHGCLSPLKKYAIALVFGIKPVGLFRRNDPLEQQSRLRQRAARWNLGASRRSAPT